MTLAYRAAAPSDHHFIYDSWARSYRTSRHAGLLAMDRYPAIMREQIALILALPDTVTRVAYDPGEEDQGHDLYGWICSGLVTLEEVVRYQPRWVASLIPRGLRPSAGDKRRLTEAAEREVGASVPLLHYMFVKSAYRKKGIGRGLLRSAGIDATGPIVASCWTGIAANIAASRDPVTDAPKLPKTRFDTLFARFAMATPKTNPEETDGNQEARTASAAQ